MQAPSPSAMDVHELTRLAQQAGKGACHCRMAGYRAWTSITDMDWPSSMRKVGSLRDERLDEPTWAEYHPDGTRYDSPDAPVAPAFFPYNRCEVYRCGDCGAHVLRYTEFGGYYVDHRVRCLHGLDVVDMPVAPGA